MLLGDRSKKIMDELISNPRVTSTVLEKKYEISRRQLGYSFNKINEWLMAKNLPVIERTRQGHFIIDQSVFTLFSTEEVVTPLHRTDFTEEQRVYFIIMMLLSSSEELSLSHFTSELQVSKNTVLSDLKQVQRFLHDYTLTIRYTRKSGYLLEGKEFQMRKLLINVSYKLLQLNGGEEQVKKIAQVKEEELKDIKERIENVEIKLNLKFTDEKLATMPYILCLILKRIDQGREVTSFSITYEELSDTKEYLATEEIFKDLKEIPVQERLFMTLHLLTANVYWSEYLSENDDVPNLLPAIDQMVRHFEKSACIYLQEREQLLNKLLQHIKPAYYRIKYELTETVEMQEALSQEFKELHHLVRSSTAPLNKLIGQEIPDNELTFITLLIGGWMRRQGDSIEEKVKAIVVCPQGVSVSRLMFHELRELFPEFIFLDSLSIREFLNYELEYDIVFSATSLETNQRLFITKAFLDHEEKYRLRKQVMLDLHGYIANDIHVSHLLDIIKNHAVIQNEKDLSRELEQYIKREDDSSVKINSKHKDLNLNDLITPKHITMRHSLSSWEKAIEECARPLIQTGQINSTYVDAMVKTTDRDPYIIIGPNIAIPHAAPEAGVNEVGMSLLKLTQGVKFNDEYTVNLIIVIAAVDKQQHIHSLMQLMKLASSEKDRDRIIHSGSVQEIHSILTNYSTE
ncbi:BglG family transcription antiterminator [Halobacillus sp. A5]|uniref:BglG family transcription antiterminator n=1 Tax=Halobacillus sp. A5 TaxID=2880263 RepID=UPI0020A66D87|nr:BglG family transcription antiterminator [Halobacillus sp. A5]MCP3027971.1 BglG family transcription antiterminator [Halobacillus sp. A5]